MFTGVRGMVIATAVKVAPKEGDTVDRAKYMQVGLKPYLNRIRICTLRSVKNEDPPARQRLKIIKIRNVNVAVSILWSEVRPRK